MTTVMSLLFIIMLSWISMTNNALSMILFIISSMICMNIIFTLNFNSSWLFLLFTLLTLGGMMIIFIYMSSISSNINLKFNVSILSITMVILLPYILNMDFKYNILLMSSKQFNKCTEYPQLWLLMLIVIYLLISMTLILNMTSNMKSPLRAKF